MPVFAVKGFKVTGDNPLSDADTTRVLAAFLRADATIDNLQKATAALEAAMQAKGFALHRVALLPQELGDTVALQIVKFTLGKVTTEGLKNLAEANVRASVPELQEGQTPNFRTLAVQTTIANENQGKQIQVALKESDEADKIDANIVVSEGKPWSFGVSLANTGAPSSGEDRLTFSGGYSNLFNRDHQLSAAYTTSIERASDVKQFGLNYRIPLYSSGSVLGFALTRSDVVGNFGTFNSTGAGHTMGLNYARYLPPEGGYRGYFTLGLDDKVFDVAQVNGLPVPGQLLRRSRPLTLGYNARSESDATAWGYNAELAVNLGGGEGNTVAAYASEDPRVSTTRWTALRGGASLQSATASGWLLAARGQFQFSAHPLIAGEQFGLGGASTIRGSGERPISGDQGLLTSFELTTPETWGGLRFIGFVDLGWLSNHNPNGTIKPATDQLASAGLGLRWVRQSYALTADFGQIVTGSSVPVTLNSAIPQKGDHKLHVNLSTRF